MYSYPAMDFFLYFSVFAFMHVLFPVLALGYLVCTYLALCLAIYGSKSGNLYIYRGRYRSQPLF